MINVTMPKLGLTMTEGTITEWRKKEGEAVKSGDIIYVIETEKVSFEVESPGSGTLANIVAREGDVVPVGGVVAYLLEAGEKPGAIPQPAKAKAEARASDKPGAAAQAAAPEKLAIPAGVKVSPLARKIAQENNIDIAGLKGSGPDGRIVKEDVLKAVEASKGGAKPAAAMPAAQALPEEGQKVPLTSMRRTIAKRMTDSFTTTPHFWVMAEADMSNLMKLRTQLMPLIEKETGIKLTYTDILVKVAAVALKRHPNVNASWTDTGIVLWPQINIGIATEVPTGLIVPVIPHADKKSLAEIAVARADIVTKGRAGTIGMDALRGGTFTLNNVGALGIKGIDAIVNPPESAILTIGGVIDRPVAIKGEVVIRPVADLSVGADHRTLDGASCGRFLAFVKELIENPSLLIL